ncbi:MAG: hypothetical protein R6X25_13945 [Candidatus Krumholzibacteriia bacterium]
MLRTLQSIRNRVHRWRRRLGGGTDLAFVYHQRYLLDIALTEYDPERGLKVLSYLQERKLLRQGMLHRPRPASLHRLQLVHHREYLRHLQEPGALDTIVGHQLNPADQDAFLASQRAMVGGTLRATKLALDRCCTAVNLGGGLHHALPDRGSGFCCFNDVAVAIASFRQRGFREPVLVVDLDLHDGDALRTIYAGDPTVHTFSIHNHHLAATEAVESTSIALGSEITDAEYLEVLRREFPTVANRFGPGLVFYLAGSDLHVEDRVGDARMSMEGLVARDRLVMATLRGLQPRPACVILLAGGYGPHAWRHAAAFFSWLLTGRPDYEPPLDLTLPLDQYRRLGHLLANPERSDAGEDESESWALTDADLGWSRGLGDDRFLGRYSRHGVEMALEESGLLQRLREKGYRHPRVEFDLADPLGHTVRVVSRDDGVALIELKLRIDAKSEPPHRFLAVEWLLLQDAAQHFRLDRPLLPGQKYPGLGLLRDVAALLVVLGEGLDADGLLFVPAHYYIADRAHYVAHFLDPVHEARFRAVRRTLRHLKLHEASAAVESRRVRDRSTGEPYVYHPARLVIPLSERLRAGPHAQEYQAAVARAATGLAYELLPPEDGGDPAAGDMAEPLRERPDERPRGGSSRT